METCFCFLSALLFITAHASNHGNGEADRNFEEINKTMETGYIGSGKNEEKLLDIFSVERSTLEPEIQMYMDREMVASFNYTIACKDLTSAYAITVTSRNPKILQVPEMTVHVSCSNASLWDANLTSQMRFANKTYIIDGSFDVKLMSGVIGYDHLKFKLSDKELNMTESDVDYTDTYDVIVIRKLRPVDRIFRVVVYCVQIFVLTGFGAKLDLKIVKETLRRPIAPLIGFCSQYLMMPVIACVLGKVVTDESAVSLGIFVAGCCPGGGQSNMYSYLLKGDLSLSITMTTISTIAALAMLPAWIYSLGRIFLQDLEQDVVIPFSSVAIALSILVVPLCFGVFLRTKFPKVAKKLQKLLKPVIVFFAIVLLVIGIYSNLFIFRLFKLRVVLAACLLPYVGYLVGGLVATICRQPWPRIKTIALETGMQNTSIAYILLTSSFAPPMGDLAAVAPVASAVMTPIPPLLITVVYLTYQKCRKKYEPVAQDGDVVKDEAVKNGAKKDNGSVKHDDDESVQEKLTAV